MQLNDDNPILKHLSFEYTVTGFLPKKSSNLVDLYTARHPSREKLMFWFPGIQGLKFQTCESDSATKWNSNFQKRKTMDISGMEWAGVCET